MNRITICIIFLLCLGCRKKELLITNNSGDAVYFIYSPEPELKKFDGVHIYGKPDGQPSDERFNTSRILPKQTIAVPNFSGWDKTLAEEYGGTIWIHFISERVIESHSWEDIVGRGLIVEKQRYDLKSLNNKGWTITFPNE